MKPQTPFDTPLAYQRPQAQRHSIYRRFFTAAECAMLDATPPDDLSSEINLLRVLVARVLAASQRARGLDLKTNAAILATLSATSMVLARLVRVQFKLHSPLDEIRQEIEAGKEIGRRRRGVYNYFAPSPPA